MNTQTGPGADAVATPRSMEERRALLALRVRYQQGGDLFTAVELARLQFVRWLYRTGQLVP
jgi:hypothetical protein